MKRKAWLIFLLVLIISAQFVAISLFHDVERGGFATTNSVVAISKFDYVQARVYVSISPVIQNETGSVLLTLPNGTSVRITSSSYSFTLTLPRTGDFLGTSYISGPISLSPMNPLNVTIFPNIQNLPDYVSVLQAQGGEVDAQVFILTIQGEAQVAVSGYGVGL